MDEIECLRELASKQAKELERLREIIKNLERQLEAQADDTPTAFV